LSLTAIAFLVVYCAALVGAFVVNPLYGLGAYFWVFYNHPPDRWWGQVLPDLRWSYTAGIVMLIAVLGKPRLPSRPAWLNNQAAWLLIAYTLWMWLQILFAVDPTAHLEGCILFTKYIVLFFVIYQLAEDEKSYTLITWGHIIGCFIFGWIAYRMEVGGRLEQIGGPGVDDANTLAMHLTTGIAIAGFLFLSETKKVRIALACLLPFILNGVIETQSRGALVGIVAAAPIGLFLCPRGHRRVAYGAVGLGAVLLLILANDQFWGRMQTIQLTEESQMEASAASRVALIRYGWAMFKDYPLGAGHRGHEILSPSYVPEGLLTQGRRAAHNTFMQILVEQGIIGALLFVLLNVWVIRQLWRLKQMDARGLSLRLGLYRAGIGSALMAAYAAGMFIGTLKAEVHIWLLALLAALVTICEKSLEVGHEDVELEQRAVDSLSAQKSPNRFALRLQSRQIRKPTA